MIPCFNESSFLNELFEVLLKEELAWGPGFNVIFSDNDSKDNSVEITKSYLGKFQNLKILRQEINVGSRGNWASLLEVSKGDYFMFIDAHDLVTPGYFSELKSRILQNDGGIILMGSKQKMIVSGGAVSIKPDNYQYKFSKSPRIRFWQCVFYLSHCTEIHSAFPASCRNADVISKSLTFNYDHTYMFYALLDHTIQYIDGGGYVRRYWESSDSNYSHKNSTGVSETRLERAVGAQSKIVSNKTMSDEVIQRWSEILTTFEKRIAHKLLFAKYNTKYESGLFFRGSRFLFGSLTPWKISSPNQKLISRVRNVRNAEI
ncbi:glycosyltransferase family 2 protein [Candidatus Planktophila versatilis]|uniref:glycosyltransferase family 2 protein n=1 Tax=Candidatus Planktophila versatilis TaxID=1884905 RepID=UPI001CC00ABA|nr:glycosyltransferase family 2 protein [Candidatus Planktophila versatilis]